MLYRDSELVAYRYEIVRQLGQGGMGTVFRALDTFTNNQVALKKPRGDNPMEAASSQDNTVPDAFNYRLLNEFKFMAGLRHPNIVSVLDYGLDDARNPFLTMELLENPRTLLEAGADRRADDKVALVVQLLQALAYLHRHNILHLDLSPNNVMVVNNMVRVLDFGLSRFRPSNPNLEEMNELEPGGGTYPYVSPEIMREAPPTAASDMYAVGVLLYKLLVGQDPFTADEYIAFVYRNVDTQPSLEAVDSRFQPLLSGLLALKAAERYPSADAALQALGEATGQTITIETADTRASFFEAAPFVGREVELAHLQSLLDGALEGRGKACLVAGESGVGKTRLLDELRIHALTRGATVLRGECVSQGANPYHPWQEMIYRLCRMTNISLEEASVLLPVAPRLAELRTDIPTPTPLENEKEAQNRIFRTVEAVFARCPSPLVILLADIQWAGQETLDLFRHLVDTIAQKSLLLIGSYRNDERPHLNADIPGADLITLDRLDRDGIHRLVDSIFGSQRTPALADLLERESEGNELIQPFGAKR
jgi:hypothetical protein